MAVAAKVAPKIEKQHKAMPPVSRRRRKRQGIIVTRMVLCVLAMVSLLGYIGLYAQVTIYGYKRAELARSLRQIEMENQALRAEIQTLSSPDRLAGVAAANGMQQSVDVVYISERGMVRVARAE